MGCAQRGIGGDEARRALFLALVSEIGETGKIQSNCCVRHSLRKVLKIFCCRQEIDEILKNAMHFVTLRRVTKVGLAFDLSCDERSRRLGPETAAVGAQTLSGLSEEC